MVVMRKYFTRLHFVIEILCVAVNGTCIVLIEGELAMWGKR